MPVGPIYHNGKVEAATDVTTLWRYTNLLIIIIIINK